jgi:hypothetical protein
MTRGDIEVYSDHSGKPASELCNLTSEGQQTVASQITTMIGAARGDWAGYLDVADVISLEAIHAFDRHWTRKRIAEVIRSSDPVDFSNEYVVLCCELGAVLGEVMRMVRPEMVWLYDWPYWESGLWDEASGSRVNAFHWAMKKMSAYGAEDGLRPKLLAGLASLRPEA